MPETAKTCLNLSKLCSLRNTVALFFWTRCIGLQTCISNIQRLKQDGWPPRCVALQFKDCVYGSTENAAPKNAGPKRIKRTEKGGPRLEGWKMQDWKM